MMRTSLLLVVGLLTSHLPIRATQELSALVQAIEADNAAIEAIALYPEQIRASILEASLHPELIVRVASLQEGVSVTFESLLTEYSREEQEAIWELTRFPGLVGKLVEGDIKKKSQIRIILSDYPKSIHKTAMAYGRAEYDLLAEIHQLNADSHLQFEGLVERYPEDVQRAYGQLLQHPEILTLLEEDLSLTVLLGDAYEKDAEGVLALAADLNLKIAREYAERLSADGEGTSARYAGVDPELEAIATAYRQKYVYSDSEFEAPDGADADLSYVGHPYPYWFGYPRWYGYSGVHASLNWYLTPRLHASIGFYPTAHYGYRRHYAPVRHHFGWRAHHRGARHRQGGKVTNHERNQKRSHSRNQSRNQSRSRKRSSRRL